MGARGADDCSDDDQGQLRTYVGAHGADGSSDDDQDTHADGDALSPCPWALKDAEVEAELGMCATLATWEPFASPTDELVNAMVALAPHDVHRRGKGSRCLLRASVVQRISCEQIEYNQLPDRMKYHGDTRYRLKRGTSDTS